MSGRLAKVSGSTSRPVEIANWAMRGTDHRLDHFPPETLGLWILQMAPVEESNWGKSVKSSPYRVPKRSTAGIPIMGAVGITIATVPIPNCLHLASSLTQRQRQNPRLSNSGFRGGDHQRGHTRESQQAQKHRMVVQHNCLCTPSMKGHLEV